MECYISSILAGGILPRRGRGARSSAGLDGRGLLGLDGHRPSLGDAGADGMPPNRWAEMRHRPPRAPRPGRFRDVLARHAAQSPDRRRRQLRGPPDGPFLGGGLSCGCCAARYVPPARRRRSLPARADSQSGISPTPPGRPFPPHNRQGCAPATNRLANGTGRSVYHPTVTPIWSVRPCPGMNEVTSADVSGAGGGLGT